MPKPIKNDAVILTSCRPAALGRPGYSHPIVAELFRPVLKSLAAEVHAVAGTVAAVDRCAADCLSRGLRPIHLSITPLQDMPFSKVAAANIAMPAWEFPDIPDHEFDGHPQNNWIATAKKCDLLIVSGPFTKAAFQRAGVRTPIAIVPVPMPQSYFEVPLRGKDTATTLESCDHYDFQDGPETLLLHSAPVSKTSTDPKVALAKAAFRYGLRPLFGKRFTHACVEGLQSARRAYRSQTLTIAPQRSEVRLNGIVYSSIFNPGDGRKNWTDLLSAYLTAFADQTDVTLVAKLIVSDSEVIEKVLNWYLGRGFRHRCRLVFITGRLSEQGICDLIQAGDFYAQATRCEGNCLPLMNALAAGRPAITPVHSAISDYFEEANGFPVDCHPEPAAWPHDSQLRLTTTWARIVWPSLVGQFRASYQLRTEHANEYTAMAIACRKQMTTWAGVQAVTQALERAFETVAHVPESDRRLAAA